MSLVTTASRSIGGRARGRAVAISELLPVPTGPQTPRRSATWTCGQARNNLRSAVAWASAHASIRGATRRGCRSGSVRAATSVDEPRRRRAARSSSQAVASAGSPRQQLERGGERPSARRRTPTSRATASADSPVAAATSPSTTRPRGHGGRGQLGQRRRRPATAGAPAAGSARPSVREVSRSAALGVLAGPGDSTSSVGRPAQARDRHTTAVAASVRVTVASRVRQYAGEVGRVQPAERGPARGRRTGCARRSGSRASASSMRSSSGCTEGAAIRTASRAGRAAAGRRVRAGRARRRPRSANVSGSISMSGQSVVVDHLRLADVAGRLDRRAAAGAARAGRPSPSSIAAGATNVTEWSAPLALEQRRPHQHRLRCGDRRVGVARARPRRWPRP